MRDGKRWEIPAEMHPAIEQVAIVLKDAKNKDSARAFLEFVKSAAGRAILAKYGFAFPEKDQERGKKITPRGSENARVILRRGQGRKRMGALWLSISFVGYGAGILTRDGTAGVDRMGV